MRKITDTTMEDDIVEIKPEPSLIELLNKATRPFPKWFVTDWIMQQKPAKQIAVDNGVPVETIYKMLRELNKSIIDLTRS